MVIGETNASTNGASSTALQQQQQAMSSQQSPAGQQQPFGIQQATIDNIMSGIENTGAVKMNNHRKKLRQRFDIIKKLGQGTYGKVQLGINKETGQEVAIKTIKKSKIETEADLIRIRREVQIMSSVQHPNIIHIYEVFENREKMVLVMEFAAGGELYDYLSDRKVLNEEEARRIFRQVSTAIYYCHKHKICHRDLKLENILLDEQGNAKIADFGLSNVFDEQRLLATFCGSPLYASPEIVKGTPYQGPEVDCWSLGVLLYTLVYGAMPFDGANFKRLVKQISQGDYFEPKKPSRASPLIREMLTVCPIRRANIESICNHWWVNEGYDDSCLNLAEELANQTPVRLDVLLSLAPPSVTSDQLVVPHEEPKGKERIHKSHSVGSIIDIAPESEAERRILDMVAAGGEAALMPSPTRTITPQESPAQPKRKLETTVSTENATGGAKKKEKAIAEPKLDPSKKSIPEAMEIDVDTTPSPAEEPKDVEDVKKKREDMDTMESLKKIEEICDDLMEKTAAASKTPVAAAAVPPEPEKKLPTPPKIPSPVPVSAPVEKPTEPTATPTPKKTVVKKQTLSPAAKKDGPKNKTADLSGAIDALAKDKELVEAKKEQSERKNSLPEENLVKPAERRRSRILETAEKFQNMNNQNNEKYRKFTIPGVSVGNFKKEFERKASLTTQPERKSLDRRSESTEKSSPSGMSRKNSGSVEPEALTEKITEKQISSTTSSSSKVNDSLAQSDSKTSVGSFSLEEARRSMENSLALLNKARTESKEVEQLCAKTETVQVSDENEREKKLRAAREIIGNAIPPSRLIGIRKPPVFGFNGRSISGSVVQPNVKLATPLKSQFSADSIESRPQPRFGATTGQDRSNRDTVVPEKVIPKEAEIPGDQETKTSHAEITLKSATLPRRKPTTKSEIQVEIPPVSESPLKFSTEFQHQVPDLRSAPIREHPTTYSSFVQNRATSLEPQNKEHVIPIQKPPTYQRTTSNNYRNSLSRQSTNESNDSDTTPTQSSSFMQSSSTITSAAGAGEKQPIKKSPREFIIPISVEGGGIVTPRADSLEQSESSATTASSASKRIGRPRKIGSIFEKDNDDDGFPKLHRHTSLGRESDSEDQPRFHSMHRLRSSRPTKRTTTFSQDPNESASSGEEDDDDGFELLTAENLFSTLLSRVRALTHRLNVNNDTNTNFPSSRLMSNLRQTQSPFWNHDPFSNSRLNGSNMSPWRHSMARDFHSDIDSMFSRSGATLPRGKKTKNSGNSNNDRDQTEPNAATEQQQQQQTNHYSSYNHNDKNNNLEHCNEVLDLGDLDLSQLRLTKKDLETLSSLTPSLSKNLQEQLLAQLPPNQAKKLSRTLSMQNGQKTTETAQVYRRSTSTNREAQSRQIRDSVTPTNEMFDNLNNNNTAVNNSRYRRSSSRELDNINNNNSNNNSTLTNGRNRELLSPIEDISKSKYSQSYYSSLKSTRDEYSSLPPRPNCVSPPPIGADDTLTRRSQKRISRFLRPDGSFTAEPKLTAEEKYNREMEAQLDSIRREKSRERTDRLSYLLDLKYGNEDLKEVQSHQHLSANINEKILDELNNISLLNSQLEHFDAHQELPNGTNENVEKEKVKKKVKVKTDGTKKTIKKKTATTEEKDLTSLDNSLVEDLSEKSKLKAKESKIARPKSYPSKEPGGLKLPAQKSSDKLDQESPPEPVVIVEPPAPVETGKNSSSIESKLSRPKSFPSSKITPPKDTKKPPQEPSPPKNLVKEPSPPKTNLVNSKEPSPPKVIPTAKEPSPPKNLVIKEPSPLKNVVMLENGIADKIPTETEPKKVKKVIKVVKKKISAESNSTPAPNSLEVPVDVVKEKSPEKREKTPDKKEKEKSPEKKQSRGLLYTIGQKFEKLRETKKEKDKEKEKEKEIKEKEKEKKIETSIPKPDEEASADAKDKKKKSKHTSISEDVDEATKQERKSRIDAMIQNLRERSVPRHPEFTESNLIKRAVSVEEMPNTFNKQAVSKVLGLFKKIEKDGSKSDKVQNTKSTSYLNSMESSSSSIASSSKERPKSSGFVNKLKSSSKTPFDLTNICESRIPVKYSCPDCKQIESKTEREPITVSNLEPSKSANAVTKRHSTNEFKQTMEEKERIKNNRKGLMLDLNKISQAEIEVERRKNEVNAFLSNHIVTINHNKKIGNSSSTGKVNSCSFPPPLPHELNQNLLTPTYDSLTNYSSSPYDDHSSTTMLSPTDDHEYFDDWSTCSDDHNLPPMGTSSLSRLSRYSQHRSQIQSLDSEESPESVVDRIRRKSFYSRFNEKKPKRVSNIVGPAAKDYYRERSRPLEYTKSATSIIPDITGKSNNHYDLNHIRATPTRFPVSTRSVSTTRATTTKYNCDKSSINDSTLLPHSSSYRRLNYDMNGDHLVSLPPQPHHHHHHHDLLQESHSSRLKSIRSTMYDSSSSSSNTTPFTVKRRSSFTTPTAATSTTSTSSSTSNGLTTKSSIVDGYATVGRKLRQYNSRTMSMLDPSSYLGSSHLSDYRNGLSDHTGSLSSRSIRYRNSSVPRSPTNI